MEADSDKLLRPGSGRNAPASVYLQPTGYTSPGKVTMPIRSQHLTMSVEEWKCLPYQPGWKYEYWDGGAHITPNHQIAVTAATVTPRPVNTPCTIRDVRPEDEAPLLAVYLGAFADNQAFCDYTDAAFLDAARRDLHESFIGRRAPVLAASRVAAAAEVTGEQLVGAALLSQDQEYGPVLDLLFVRPRWQRRGMATALVASAMNVLHQAGEGTLTSCYQLANPASQAWHRAFGFVERPDLRYAQAYYRRAQQELFRHEKCRELAAAERAALQADVQYWYGQLEALERLGEAQGFAAVYPRLPHW